MLILQTKFTVFLYFYHTRAKSVQRTIKMFTSPNLTFNGNKKIISVTLGKWYEGRRRMETWHAFFWKIPHSCFALKLSKLGTKNVQLVLQHCCKTKWIAMLCVLPTTFEPVFQQYKVERFSWSVKRATSLNFHLVLQHCMLQNKLHVLCSPFYRTFMMQNSYHKSLDLCDWL